MGSLDSGHAISVPACLSERCQQTSVHTDMDVILG